MKGREGKKRWGWTYVPFTTSPPPLEGYISSSLVLAVHRQKFQDGRPVRAPWSEDHHWFNYCFGLCQVPCPFHSNIYTFLAHHSTFSHCRTPTYIKLLGQVWGSRRWSGPSWFLRFCCAPVLSALTKWDECHDSTTPVKRRVKSTPPNPRQNQEMWDSEQRDGTPRLQENPSICGSTDQTELVTVFFNMIFLCFLHTAIYVTGYFKTIGWDSKSPSM